MPLRLDLKPREKLFVGGAVLVNGDSRSTFTVLNDVPILREKDILTEAEANTPCKRIYLCVQLMYMDPAGFEKYNQLYLSLMKDVIQAAPSTASLLTNIGEEVLAGQYYVALKQAMKLVKYEKELVSHVGQSA
jgi:flagellar protein FlbT